MKRTISKKKLYVGTYNLSPMTPAQMKVAVKRINKSPVIAVSIPKATTQSKYLRASGTISRKIK
jgi:hypothetical protein